MKQLITLLVCTGFLYFLNGCSSGANESKPAAESDEALLMDEEKEDGIREAQEMDFELTKDIRLGYVPKQRLVEAYERVMKERRSGIASRTSALTWTERGPNTNAIGPSNGNTRGPGNTAVTSGRMRAIWVDLNDATNKTVWAGSVSGGLWKTNDITVSPANWVLVNDFLGNLAVTSICQDPVNKNNLYFATGERNFNLDAVRGGGIWKSTDNGATWNLLANTTNFWNVSKIVCDAAGNVYVGTNGNNQGLQRSTNGGASWTNITPSTAGNGNRISEIRFSSTGRLHVTISTGTATSSGYFYTDAPATVTSATWTAPVTPFPNVQFNCEIAVAGNTLYALPSDASDLTPQVYKSTDGGANWVATLTSPPSTGSEPTINAGQGWYDLAIGVDPANPNIVIAGGLNFYRTTNGGDTWSQITRWVGTTINYVHADHHGVVWNGAQVLVATDGGIFYSNNNGASFVDRNIGLRTKQFYSCAIHPTTTNYFLAGAQDNGTHQLTNAGLGGSTEVHGGDGGFVHIDENEPQFQFSATTRSQYRRSTNSGANWSGSIIYSSGIGQFINPTDYDDINNRMYTSAAAGTYVRWDNPQTGATFTSVSISSATSNSVLSLKVSPYTNNRVFFGALSGRLVRVDDAHTDVPTVTNITGTGMPASTVSCINVGTNDNNLIATFSNYGAQHVWMSTTGGGAAGWVNISGNIPDIPVRWGMFYPDNNDRAIIATDMGIFETDDINGASTVWVQNTGFPSVRTNMFQYRFTDRTLLAATHGRGVWTAPIPADIPYVRFGSSYTYTTNVETNSATTGCRNYRDFTVNMRIDAAPTGNAVITLATGAGTATEGVDFDYTTNGNFAAPSKQLTFLSGAATPQPITIRIYDDAELENTESFTLTYTIGGGTNAVAAPSSPSYTVITADNDLLNGNAIETVLSRTKTLSIDNTGLNYFIAQGTTNIMSQMSGAAANLGCVTTTIFEAGNTWQNYFAGQRSQKVFDVAVSSNPNAAYTIGLYVTLDELGGKTPSTINIAKSSAASMAGVNSGNTFIYQGSFVSYGTGYVFSATVSGSGKFFLTDGFATGLFDVSNRVGNFARLLQNPVSSSIYLKLQNEKRVNITATLFTGTGQKLKVWNLGKADGNAELPLTDAKLANGSYVLRVNAGDKMQTFKVIKK